jgi:hypothetical protein
MFSPKFLRVLTEGVDLSGDPNVPNMLQNPEEAGIRGEAHGSIRIQEGEPN